MVLEPPFLKKLLFESEKKMPHMGMDQIDTIFGGDEHPEIHRDEIHIYIYHIAILVPFAMFVWLVIDLPL